MRETSSRIIATGRPEIAQGRDFAFVVRSRSFCRETLVVGRSNLMISDAAAVPFSDGRRGHGAADTV